MYLKRNTITQKILKQIANCSKILFYQFTNIGTCCTDIYKQQNKWYPKGVDLSISKLHSILAVANLLVHNNKSQICYCGQISLQSAAVNCSFTDTFGSNIYFATDGTTVNVMNKVIFFIRSLVTFDKLVTWRCGHKADKGATKKKKINKRTKCFFFLCCTKTWVAVKKKKNFSKQLLTVEKINIIIRQKYQDICLILFIYIYIYIYMKHRQTYMVRRQLDRV